MDLGIAGRWAILLGSSRGLGRACAESIAREGVNVVVNGRTAADVERTAAEITSHHGVEARAVVGDSTTSEVHEALLAACAAPDIVLLNGEGPSPVRFGELDPAQWGRAVHQGKIGRAHV